MTTITDPQLPIPAGATADEWCHLTEHPEDLIRFVKWSSHDFGKIGVCVDGAQYGDGRVERQVTLYGADGVELTADDARALAAKLTEAADALERLA